MIRLLARFIALLLLLYILGLALFTVLLPRPAGAERTDAIVVLTGGSGRIERGLDLLGKGVSPRMFISGVARTVRPNELAEAYRIDRQKLACCITLGRESFDTRSNADEVARWVERRKIKSIRLVTHDLHMPRARYELSKRVEPDLVIVSDAVQTQPRLPAIFVEYNKYLLGRAAELVGI